MPYDAGIALALPDYARLDLAWQESLTVGPASGSGPTVTYTVPGLYIDVLVSLTANYAAGGVSTTPRIPALQYLDANGNVFAQVTAIDAVDQGDGSTISFIAGLDNAYSTPPFQTIGCPVIPMLPTYQFQLTAFNSQPGDVWSQPDLAILHIPTGPPIDTSQPAIVLPPILAAA